MLHSIHTDEDREVAEDTVKNAVFSLEEGDLYLVKHRNRWRKQIINEMAFLREHFPNSEVHQLDMSKISLELEKE